MAQIGCGTFPHPRLAAHGSMLAWVAGRRCGPVPELNKDPAYQVGLGRPAGGVGASTGRVSGSATQA